MGGASSHLVLCWCASLRRSQPTPDAHLMRARCCSHARSHARRLQTARRHRHLSLKRPHPAPEHATWSILRLHGGLCATLARMSYNRLQGLRTPTTTPRRRRPPSYFCAGPFFDAVSPARQEAPWPLRSLLLLPQCMVEAGPALRTSASAELAAQLGRDDCTFEGVCIRLQKTARWAAC